MNEDLQELLSWLQKQATGPTAVLMKLAPYDGGTYAQGCRYAYLAAALRVRMLIAKTSQEDERIER